MRDELPMGGEGGVISGNVIPLSLFFQVNETENLVYSFSFIKSSTWSRKGYSVFTQAHRQLPQTSY